MKNHRFPWLRNRTTDNRKCEKARNIKEKRTIEMFNTVSKKQEERASSQSVNWNAAIGGAGFIPARHQPRTSHSCGRPPNSNPWNRGLFLWKESCRQLLRLLKTCNIFRVLICNNNKKYDIIIIDGIYW